MRSVVVKLRAEVAEFKRSLGEASKATEEVGKKAEATAKSSTTALGQMTASAANHGEQWTKVGASVLGAGMIVAAGLGLSIAKFAEYDQAMSQVQAATHETSANMDRLRDASMEAGAETQYSATEAAGAIEELAKAGVGAKDVLAGGLDGALNLAAAGTMDVGTAAEIAATALTMFKLKGSDIPHVADLLAAGAGKAQGSVEDMGLALKQAGLVADATGLSIEETTAGLAAFASAGLVGSDAGTSFKSMLQRLTPQSAEAKRAMEELGISAYDSQGQFIGLSKFAGNLQSSMKDLTPEARNAAMSVIFGSDAVRASTVLYDQGAAGIENWIGAVDSSGYAAETARLKTDNLRGDVERLGGAFDTALIQTGAGADGVLRSMTQTLTSMIDVYGSAPAPVQELAIGIGAVTAVVAIAGGGFLLMAPKVLAAKTAIDLMSTSMPKAAGALRVLGIAAGVAGGILTVATIGLGIWATSQANAKAEVEALAETLDQTTGALTDMSREAIKTKLSTKDTFLWFDDADSAYNNAEKLGIGLDLVTEAASGNVDALSKVNDILKTGAVGTTGYQDAVAKSGLSVEEFDGAANQLRNTLKGSNETLDEAVRVTQQKQDADTAAADGSDALAAAAARVTDATEAETKALDEWMAMVSKADASFIDITAGYDAVIAKNTEIATSTADATESTTDSWSDYYDGQTVSSIDYIASLQAQVDAQTNWETNMLAISDRVQMGMTGDMATAATNMIDELLNLGPEGAAQVQLLKDMSDEEFAQVVTLWSQKGTEAVQEFTNKVEGYRQPVININADATTAQAAYDGLGRPINTTVTFSVHGYEDARAKYDGLGRPINGSGFKVGGYTGDGGVSDVAGVVHGKEFVSNARATAEHRGELEAWNRGMPGYQGGGYVTPRYMSAVTSSSQAMAAAPAGAAFPAVVTLMDSDGSLLGHMRVIADTATSAGQSASARDAAGRRRTGGWSR